MNEDAFRDAFAEANERKCAFEKALLTRKHGCSQLEIFFIANRRGCNCKNESNAQQCQRTIEFVREKAKFILHLKKIILPLPHSKEIKIQLGSLNAFSKFLGKDPNNIFDVYSTITEINNKFSNLDEMPVTKLLTEIQKIETKRAKK